MAPGATVHPLDNIDKQLNKFHVVHLKHVHEGSVECKVAMLEPKRALINIFRLLHYIVNDLRPSTLSASHLFVCAIKNIRIKIDEEKVLSRCFSIRRIETLPDFVFTCCPLFSQSQKLFLFINFFPLMGHNAMTLK